MLKVVYTFIPDTCHMCTQALTVNWEVDTASLCLLYCRLYENRCKRKWWLERKRGQGEWSSERNGHPRLALSGYSTEKRDCHLLFTHCLTHFLTHSLCLHFIWTIILIIICPKDIVESELSRFMSLKVIDWEKKLYSYAYLYMWKCKDKPSIVVPICVYPMTLRQPSSS